MRNSNLVSRKLAMRENDWNVKWRLRQKSSASNVRRLRGPNVRFEISIEMVKKRRRNRP